MIRVRQILNELITDFNLKSFLEIGYWNGETHETIKCLNKVAVDPDPRPALSEYTKHDVKIMSSDDFFETNKQTFDLILVDGSHEANQVYKDVVNSLNFLNPRGIIFMHDVCPLTESGTLPSASGDAFKTFMKIRCERDDLDAFLLDDFTAQDNTGFGIIIKNTGFSTRYTNSNVQYTYKFMKDRRDSIMNISTLEYVKACITERNKSI